MEFGFGTKWLAKNGPETRPLYTCMEVPGTTATASSKRSEFLCYRFTAYDRLTMPALIIVGKYDGAVGVDQMRNLADHLPRARFDEFDESAHFPYAEEPEKFEHDIADFLSGHTTGNEP
jgi:pimeloyl-ACP methyl ester carboxylesterase